MIIFENDGEIDPRFISTFGVNVKENDNPIGFFGTGLKYALAILMREGLEVVITSGVRTFFVTKKAEELRGKSFEMLYLNDERLGFTTELGKNWELWMAYRELVCNTIDEGGTISRTDRLEVQGQEGKTRVIVVGSEFEAVYAQHGKYFLMSNALLTGPGCEVHSGSTEHVYYKGMLAGKLSKPALFTYNISGSVTLTEDRNIKYQFEVDNAVVATVLKSTDKELIRKVVAAGDDTYERSLNFKDAYIKPEEPFLDVVGELSRSTVCKVNSTALERFQMERRAVFSPSKMQPTAVQQQMMEKALKFCASIGFKIEHEVVLAIGLGTGILGLAHEGRIYIAEAAFNQGTKRLAGTLVEEHIHLVHGHADNSRGMQDFLLDKLMSLGEELTGEPL